MTALKVVPGNILNAVAHDLRPLQLGVLFPCPILCLQTMRAGGHYSLFIKHEVTTNLVEPLPRGLQGTLPVCNE